MLGAVPQVCDSPRQPWPLRCDDKREGGREGCSGGAAWTGRYDSLMLQRRVKDIPKSYHSK